MQTEARVWLRADNALRDMRTARDKAFRVAFPVGCEVEWVRGGYPQSGTVRMHGHADSVKVQNGRTGNEVWITGYDIKWVIEDADGEPSEIAIESEKR